MKSAISFFVKICVEIIKKLCNTFLEPLRNTIITQKFPNPKIANKESSSTHIIGLLFENNNFQTFSNLPNLHNSEYDR